jgi:hypothetical protein
VGDLEHCKGRDPGREARQTHQGQADEKRKQAPECRRKQQRLDVADRVVAQEREDARQHPFLRCDGHGHDAGREGADGDEADLAERENARDADENVDRDHDRDRDERVQEVDLVRGGGGRRDEADENDEQHRAEQLDDCAKREPEAHTRSIAALRPHAKSPAGRSSRTTITNA